LVLNILEYAKNANKCIIQTMNKENIIDITPYIKPQEQVDTVPKAGAKHHSNPIMKKQFVISVKNNVHKFSVADLFD